MRGALDDFKEPVTSIEPFDSKVWVNIRDMHASRAHRNTSAYPQTRADIGNRRQESELPFCAFGGGRSSQQVTRPCLPEEPEVAQLSVELASGGPELFRRDGASSYAWWGNIAVVLGRRPPSASHVANYRACVVELHKRYPQGVGLVTVVNDTATPEQSGRDAMITMFKELWPLMNGALFVPNAEGFKAAVMRSVAGCLILATGERDRVRVESSVRAGVPWLASKVIGPHAKREQWQQLEQGISRFCESESSWQGVP